MSGGHYNYAYEKVEEMAATMAIEHKNHTDPQRLRFMKLLPAVATAMREVEWVDSYDNSPGDEYPAIESIFALLRAAADEEYALLRAENEELRSQLGSRVCNSANGLGTAEVMRRNMW